MTEPATKTVPALRRDTGAAGTEAAIPTAGETRSLLATVGLGEILVQLGLTPVVAVIPGLAAALGVPTQRPQ